MTPQEAIELVPQGPGAADYGDGWGNGYGWRSADASLNVEYMGVTERATVAELTMVVSHIEGDDARQGPLSTSIELSYGDLIAIVGVASALANQAKQEGAR